MKIVISNDSRILTVDDRLEESIGADLYTRII